VSRDFSPRRSTEEWKSVLTVENHGESLIGEARPIWTKFLPHAEWQFLSLMHGGRQMGIVCELYYKLKFLLKNIILLFSLLKKIAEVTENSYFLQYGKTTFLKNKPSEFRQLEFPLTKVKQAKEFEILSSYYLKTLILVCAQ
jgi:hypothetical protein